MVLYGAQFGRQALSAPPAAPVRPASERHIGPARPGPAGPAQPNPARPPPHRRPGPSQPGPAPPARPRTTAPAPSHPAAPSCGVPRTRLRRLPERQVDDRLALDSLLDEALVAHVGVVVEGQPVVLPTAFARDGDRLLLHGSTGSGWMRSAAAGAPACVTVTLLDGLVVARSAFESSMRYRSAVIFGVLDRLPSEERDRALELLTDKLLPGRRGELRASTRSEQRRTMVLSMPLACWSLKVSDGWPEDSEEDRAGSAWAGLVPLRLAADPPVAAPDLEAEVPLPASVEAFVAGRNLPGPHPDPGS